MMILKIRAAMITSLFMATNNLFANVSGSLRGQNSEQRHPAEKGVLASKYSDDGEIVQDVKLFSRQLAKWAERHVASGINGTTTTLQNVSVVESSSEDDMESALPTVPNTTTVSTKNENITHTPIYDEASDMLTAKNPHVYVGEEAILNNDSVTSQEIYGFVKDNIDILKNEKDFKGEDGDFAFKQLQALLNLNNSEDLKDDSEIIIFNDKDTKQLCYGLGLNKVKKWIVVSFRGTSSTFDIVDNIKVAGEDAENPLYRETPNQKRNMQIHKGFYNALFKDIENGVTKFDFIMNQILQLKKENPEFKLYVTGHSLGGALATLFAFYASTSKCWGDLFPFPVTCVSVASPLVGDYNWRCAFMLQEKLGKIRHLRISNYCDVVPKVPCLGLDIPPFTYKHVGIHLQLYDDKPPRLSFPVNGHSPKIDTDENAITPITPSQILYFHGCDLYVDRLNKGQKTLEGKYLNSLYADPAFVGKYNNV